jgi:hypothetical protein
MTTLKEMRKKVSDQFSHVSLSREGVFTVKQGYFYHHGNSPETLWAKVQHHFPDAILVEKKDDWKAWPKDSNLVVKFKFNLEEKNEQVLQS